MGSNLAATDSVLLSLMDVICFPGGCSMCARSGNSHDSLLLSLLLQMIKTTNVVVAPDTRDAPCTGKRSIGSEASVKQMPKKTAAMPRTHC